MKEAFVEALEREVDAAWRRLAITELRRERAFLLGKFFAGDGWLPTEEAIAEWLETEKPR